MPTFLAFLFEPFSLTAFLTSLAVSAAITGAAYLVGVIFAPKPKPLQRGKLSGDVYVQNGDPGSVIKWFGGGPTGDGLGAGTLTAGDVLWMSAIRKVVTTTTVSSGGGKKTGGGSQQVQDTNYYVDLLVMFGWGVLDYIELRANSTTLFLGQSELVGVIFEAESASLVNAIAPAPNAGASNGQVARASGLGIWTINVTYDAPVTGTYTLRVYYAATLFVTLPSVRVYVDGAAVTTAVTLAASPDIETFIFRDFTFTMNQGSREVGLRCSTANSPADVDYFRITPPTGALTGMVDPDAIPDPDFTQDAIPSPTPGFTLDRDRVNHLPPPDEFGVISGVSQNAGYASLTFYPGNDEQMPDSTYEAAINAKFGGTGWASAFRRRSYASIRDFHLNPYGGSVPLFLARVASRLLTMQAVMTERARLSGVGAARVDFSAWASIKVRGTFVTQIESAKQLHDGLALTHNTAMVEHEGKVVGVVLGATGTVNVDEEDLGVVDENFDAQENSPLSRVEVTYPPDTDIPATMNLTYYSPAKKYERSNVSYTLIGANSQRVEQLEVSETLTDAEALAAVTREVHRRWREGVEGYSWRLPYKYAYAKPTDIFVITDTIEAASYSARAGSMHRAPGSVIDLTGVPEDSAYYEQPAVTLFDGEQPEVPFARSTVGVLIDSVLLNPADETTNNGIGFYAGGTPRDAQSGRWSGWSLWRYRFDWELIGSSSLPATIGTAVNALEPTAHFSIFDDHPAIGENRYLDVDVYGDRQLSSATDAELFNGKNRAILGTDEESSGGEMIQFKNAVKLEGFANRWRLSGLRRGLNGTDHAADDHQVGDRFVLLDEAIVFVPLPLAEVNTERDHQFVTNGQSRTEASVIRWPWLGGTKRPLAPIIEDRAPKTGTGDLLISLSPRTRVGQGIRDFLPVSRAEEDDIFWLNFPEATPPRRVRVTDARRIAVLITDPDKEADFGQLYQVTAESLSPHDSILSAVIDAGFLAPDIAIKNELTKVREYVLTVENVGSDTRATAAHWDGSAYVTLGTLTVTGLVKLKVSIEIVDSQVLFFAAPETGVADDFARSSIPTTDKPLLRGASFHPLGIGSNVANLRVRSGKRSYVYTEGDQIADFGSAREPGTLKVEAWQESALLGLGYKAEKTL